MLFLRKVKLDAEPMPIKMSGVRMGERLLQVGMDNPKLAGTMAAKVGLSGSAAMLVFEETAADKARAAAAESGALLDVHVAPAGVLPYDDAAFDVVVIHSMTGLLPALDARVRGVMLEDSYRVLRHGGRVIVLQPGRREGLAAVLRPATLDPEYEATGGSLTTLEAAGFKPVRLLAEREGYRFFEGLKT